MEIEVKGGKSGYVIRSAWDALECVAIVETFVDSDAAYNTDYGAAANGLDRWLKRMIAEEENHDG